MRRSNFVTIALIVLLGLLTACSSTVPATVTRPPSIPFDKGKQIDLFATRQRDRIAQSLKDAGLKVAERSGDGAFALKAAVGSSRGSTECGTTNNVTYILSGSGGRIMVIKGRGPTGTCSPNIFDDMSRKLAESGK